jgi:hypothetical protein
MKVFRVNQTLSAFLFDKIFPSPLLQVLSFLDSCLDKTRGGCNRRERERTAAAAAENRATHTHTHPKKKLSTEGGSRLLYNTHINHDVTWVRCAPTLAPLPSSLNTLTNATKNRFVVSIYEERINRRNQRGPIHRVGTYPYMNYAGGTEVLMRQPQK